MPWEWRKTKKIKYLTIPEWSKSGVQAVFSTRDGGVSEGAFSSLNLALHVNDNADDVLQNRKTFLSELGYSEGKSIVAEQVHGVRVIQVTRADLGRGMKLLNTAIPECDGMVTLEAGVGLLCFYADCVPLYFFNPKIGIVGLAHAGWKGTAGNIIKEALAKISLAGGRPEECLAAIGPCIGSCCYEVGENVASVIREKFNEVSRSVITEASPGKYKLDLIKANEVSLISEGVPRENISIANLCTFCNASQFYSYRREGVTGRMAAFIRKDK